MTLLAAAMETLASLYSSVAERALGLLEEALAPAGPIPRRAVENLVRRAIRNGGWRLLSREQQALLLAAARTPVSVYRSPTLLAQLRRAWAVVEQATSRGRALLAALTHLLARGARLTGYTVRRLYNSLVALGLQLLNTPQPYQPGPYGEGEA